MIVYADREEIVDSRAFSRRIQATGDPQERLILEGQYESAVTDVLCRDFDEEVNLSLVTPPPRIAIRKPEGYAFYSLYPDLFRDAALRFVRDNSPAECVVVGIRSIGTSLSRVVAEAVNASFRFTVRPRGHPFDREVRLSADLEAKLRAYAQSAWFLVVDEGPGLSGSSFLSVAQKLEELGAPAGRIVLFPSHEPDADKFVSGKARRNWHRYAHYVEPFVPERFVPPGSRDVSGGLWRPKVYASEADYPPVQPNHERRKYLHGSELWKFSGLAHFGRTKYERALVLKQFCPKAVRFHNGFLVSEWEQARPARLSEALLDVMARYLATLRLEFARGGTIDTAGLEQMIECNTGERVEVPYEGTPVAVDGRMLRQEWLEGRDGFLKADALDHHDDHFFPGCQDIAWDIAGASVEWDFPVEALADRYLRLVSDESLYSRLPFYRTAYKAFRYGYCDMAAESLGDSPDGQRFRKLQSKYEVSGQMRAVDFAARE